MKANEIRYGILVGIDDGVGKIEHLSNNMAWIDGKNYVPIDSLIGIPATEENVRKYFDVVCKSSHIDLCGEEIRFNEDGVDFMSEWYVVATCKFIHEIQNYYYAVHKEELPLK